VNVLKKKVEVHSATRVKVPSRKGGKKVGTVLAGNTTAGGREARALEEGEGVVKYRGKSFIKGLQRRASEKKKKTQELGKRR